MLSLLLTLSLHVHATNKDCNPMLALVSSVLRHAPGPAEYQRAQGEVLKTFGELSVWRGQDWRGVVGGQISEVTLAFTSVVSARARGMDAAAGEWHREFAGRLRRILGDNLDVDQLKREVDAIAARPRVDRAFGYVRPLLYGPPPEHVIASQLPNLVTNRKQIIFGAQYAEMVRLIHQFGHYEAGERLLYVGLAAPAVLTGVRRDQRDLKLYAIDPHEPAPATHRFLSSIQATVTATPLDVGLWRAARRSRPYRVLAAVDVFSRQTDVGQRFGDPVQLALKLRQLLTPGGVLILLNDFNGQPPFSRAQAVDAGFEVLRWDVDRSLPKSLVGETFPDARAQSGELRAFVLRHGAERRVSTEGMLYYDEPSAPDET